METRFPYHRWQNEVYSRRCSTPTSHVVSENAENILTDLGSRKAASEEEAWAAVPVPVPAEEVEPFLGLFSKISDEA